MLAPLQILLYRLVPLQVGIKGLVGMYGVIFVTGLAPLEILLYKVGRLIFLTGLGNWFHSSIGIPQIICKAKAHLLDHIVHSHILNTTALHKIRSGLLITQIKRHRLHRFLIVEDLICVICFYNLFNQRSLSILFRDL